MLRQIIIGVLAISTAAGTHGQVSVDATTNKANVYYDFKGARLGMTLAEWKALPVSVWSPPSPGLRYSPSQIVCSGDPATNGRSGLSLARTRAEVAANVVVCAHARQVLSMMFKPWMRTPISIGELATSDVDYKFLDGRLYEVSVTAHTNLFKDILEGLTAKWGKPDTLVSDTTQNRMGATFPRTIQIWSNPFATVRLESPLSRIDRMNVTYATFSGAAKINAAEKAINPDANKM